jgi:hypothetical protein
MLLFPHEITRSRQGIRDTCLRENDLPRQQTGSVSR